MQNTAKNNRLDIAATAGRINPILKRYGIARASVFGSAVRDDFGPNSDVDLLIDLGDTRIGLFGLVDLQTELEKELAARLIWFFVTPSSRVSASASWPNKYPF